jgi:hypothetical protein
MRVYDSRGEGEIFFIEIIVGSGHQGWYDCMRGKILKNTQKWCDSF